MSRLVRLPAALPPGSATPFADDLGDVWTLGALAAEKVGIDNSTDSTTLDYRARRRHIDVIVSAADVSRAVWIADDNYVVEGVSKVFGTGSTSGTLQVEVLTGTAAPGTGTNQLTGTVSLAGTANTVVNGVMIATPTAIATGNRVGIVIAGTMTNLVGCVITIYLKKTG